MTTIATILTEGYADWEVAQLNAVAGSYFGIDTCSVAPGGASLRSAGGLLVTPDLALEALAPADLDALVVCGGSIWQSEQAPDLTPAVTASRRAGRLVAGICDGTVALARTGLLDTVAHTSNGPGYLNATGYGGTAHYRDVPHAIGDDGVITAPGTAPVSFMREVLSALGRGGDELDTYIAMHAAEHRRHAGTQA